VYKKIAFRFGEKWHLQMSENPFAGEYDSTGMPEMPKDMGKPKVVTSTTTKSVSKAARIEELKAKEAKLLERQKQLQEAKADTYHLPNWPTQYPLIYIDIENDIPSAARKCVNLAVTGFLCVFSSCLLNVIAVLSVTGLVQYSKINALVFAIIQGIATMYVIINISFKRLYDSCRKSDIPFTWTMIQFCFVGWCVYRFIGFPTSGSVGLATFLDLLAKDSGFISRTIAFLNTCLSGGATFYEFRVLMESQKYQKVSGRNDEEKLSPETPL